MPLNTAAWEEAVESVELDLETVRETFDTRGWSRPGRRNDPQYMVRLSEAMKFLGAVYDGRKPVLMLQEAMSTSDFPQLFGDIISRSVLASYREWPTTWQDVAKKILVRDFRDNKLFLPMLGGDSALPVVPEGTNYREEALEEQTPVTFTVKKRGRRLAFTFEAGINDDLDMLKDMPERLARAARRTEERQVTEQYVDANSPHDSLYTSALANQIVTANGASTNNPPLSIAGLQDGFTVLGNQVDEEGEPIMLDMITLVVPPALEVTARNILSATELRFDTISPGATTGLNQGLSARNWMQNRLRLVVNPYLPLINTGTSKHTQWYLFGNPNVGRPAILAAFLRGYDMPQILIKMPNAMTPGGGVINPMDGDFDTDSIQYRVRHIMTAARIDGRATAASTGLGT